MPSSRFPLRRSLIIGFTLVCAAVYGSVFILNEKNQNVAANEQWVQHSNTVLRVTDDMFYYLQDMHIGLRGFLLTGDDSFTQTFNTSRAAAWRKFADLKDLTRDNAERQEQLKELEQILLRQRDVLDTQIKRKRDGIAPSIRDMQVNKMHLDDMRRLSRTLTEDERRLLDARIIRENQTTQNYIRTIFAVSGISIIALILANAFIGALIIRRTRAEDNLRRINAEMESFTYIASHDLRSPLVNLRGFSSELVYGIDAIRPIVKKHLDSLTEKERETVENILDVELPMAMDYIHSSVDKMDKLTNGILELSRIGKRELKDEWIDVKQIVTKTLGILAHQIAEKNIKVTVSDILPHVKADPLSVDQIFGNIIDNAVKYLDPARPGQIDIGGIRDHHKTMYWVKDNGRGIRPEDMSKIFEIYRRAGDTRDIPGEGLGMAYVRSSLRRMGGMIWCESVLDKGSTFYFTISNNWKKESLDEK